MKFHPLFIFLICISTAVVTRADDWFKGSVALKDNTILKGEIAIKYDYNVILFRVGSEVMVVPAHKLLAFNIFDFNEGQNRRFVSLELAVGAATYHHFFELIVDGEISLLRKQHLVWYSIHIDEVDYDYFVKYKDELVALNKFKRHVFPMMVSATDRTMASFVRENKLSMYKLKDVIRIIDYYNQFVAGKNIIAKN